jgi:uncharacterized protein YjhX (UPF0386 family)
MTDTNHNNEQKITLMKVMKLRIAIVSTFDEWLKRACFVNVFQKLKKKDKRTKIGGKKRKKNEGQRWRTEKSRKKEEIKGHADGKERG